MINLPKLTDKQQKFILRYLTNGNNATEAYKFAYDCEKMKDESIVVEASKMLKNPNVALWINHARENIAQVFEDEIKYSAKDCFNELEEVQQRAKMSFKCYQHEIKAIELKGKLAGHFVDKHEISATKLEDVLDKLT